MSKILSFPGTLSPPKTEDLYDAGIQDTFATHCVRVEKLGPCCRLVFTVPHEKGYQPGIEHHIIARIIIPTDALPALRLMLFGDNPAADLSAARGASDAVN